MMKRLAVSLIGIVLVGVSAHRSLAVDTVTRKSTKTPASGEITSTSRTELTVKRLTKEEKVPANDVVGVKWDGEPARLGIVRSSEEVGNLQEALDGYQEALKDPKSSRKELKADIEYLIARTTAKMALADPTNLDDAIKKLDAFRTSHADSFRYYESLDYLGRLYMAKKDLDNAGTTFTQLGQAPWNDYKMAAQNYGAKLKLLENDVDGALSAFEAVVASAPAKPGAAELSQKYVAMLGKATCLTTQKKHGEAVKVLDEVIKQASATDTRLQAEAYVRQGDCLQAQSKIKEAVLAYLHVDVLFAAEKALHAEALYHLARLSSTIDQPVRGDEARARLTDDYPNSPWAKKLKAGGG